MVIGLKRANAAHVVVALLACSVALRVAAQDVAVQANVDRPTVRVNESFTYTIRAEGQLRAEPELAPLEREFDVLQRSSSSRIQFVNGQTSQVTEWQLELMPKGAGKFTLPALRVGNSFTNTVELEVLAAETASNGAPADIFMELAAEPSIVYVQSQVLFTLRLFIGVSTGRATLTPPDVTGGEAIVERLGEDNQYQTTRGGRSFIVRERRYAIFPQQAGSLTIGPATFEAMVIPDRGFSRVQRFRSGSLELTVEPAVAPPAAAANAVWLPAQRVTLEEVWDDVEEVAIGEPRTRMLIVEADGVLETQLPELAIEQQAGLRQYADQPVLEREITAQGLRSRRKVSLAVIAQAAGDLVLPGVELPWWNVAEQRWETARLEPRTVRVAPDADAPVAAAPATELPAVATPVAAPPRGGAWPIVSAVLGAGWLLTLALWGVTALRRRSAARGSTDMPALAGASHAAVNPRRELRTLRSACAVNDAAGARTALLRYAAARYAAQPPRSLGALASIAPPLVAAPILELEAHLYGGTPAAWDGRALRDSIQSLEAAADAARDRAKDDELMPLYR